MVIKINEASVKNTIKVTTCGNLLNNVYLIMNVITTPKIKSKQNVIIQYNLFIVIISL